MFMQLVFPIQPNPNPFLLKEAFANGCAKGSWQLHPVIRMLRKSSKQVDPGRFLAKQILFTNSFCFFRTAST